MANIIDLTYFQKANQLNIPLSQSAPISNIAMQTPNNQQALQLLIDKTEKSILLNSLGLTTYNELQTALSDLDTYPNFKKLVEGEEYDGKVWQGLKDTESLIAWRVLELFLQNANSQLTAVGTANINVEKGNLISPIHKIAIANQTFLYKYQGGYINNPIVSGNFIDWFGGCDNVYVSFYQYLIDRKEDFVNLDFSNFAVYEVKNSFGI